MHRRHWLKSFALFTAGSATAFSAFMRVASAAQASRPIVLYCDLAVDPAREQEMLDAYHQHFKPIAEKHRGYIDLKMLKLSKVIQGGPAPAASINYRFQKWQRISPSRSSVGLPTSPPLPASTNWFCRLPAPCRSINADARRARRKKPS